MENLTVMKVPTNLKNVIKNVYGSNNIFRTKEGTRCEYTVLSFSPEKTSKNNNISKAIEGLSDIINHLLT